ncbi:transposase [Mesorhizobium sp.]|uniref:transposase n=1 Tax=Mesorhizobium sp. TaxID=1871066 RepID=UPI00345DB3BC
MHALVDAQGRPIKLMLTAGQKSDIASAVDLIKDLPEGAMLLADKGYDANALRTVITERKAWANIPPKANRKDPICFSPFLYKARNQQSQAVPPHRNPLRQASRELSRRSQLVSIRIWLRGNESTP